MTQQGRAEEGLYTALLASAFGGVVGALLLLLFFEPLSGIALKFGSEAFFWMAIFGLTTLGRHVAGQCHEEPARGLHRAWTQHRGAGSRRTVSPGSPLTATIWYRGWIWSFS